MGCLLGFRGSWRNPATPHGGRQSILSRSDWPRVIRQISLPSRRPGPMGKPSVTFAGDANRLLLREPDSSFSGHPRLCLTAGARRSIFLTTPYDRSHAAPDEMADVRAVVHRAVFGNDGHPLGAIRGEAHRVLYESDAAEFVPRSRRWRDDG